MTPSFTSRTRLIAGAGVLALALVQAATGATVGLGSAASSPATASTITKYFGNGTVSTAAIGAEVVGGVAVDGDGNLYVGYSPSDDLSHVAVFDSSGKLLRSWKLNDSINGGGRDASVLAVGPDGNIYEWVNSDPETVGVYTPAGTLVRQLALDYKPGLTQVGGLAVDAKGSIYMDTRGSPNDVVVRFDSGGKVTGVLVPLPGRPGGNGTSLGGLAAGPDGSVWVTTNYGDAPLVHLTAAGHALPELPLQAILGVPTSNGVEARDVALQNGVLYLSGSFGGGRSFVGLAVVSTSGQLIDTVYGDGEHLAVHGDDVYVTGLAVKATTRMTAGLAGLAGLTRATDDDLFIGRLAGKPIYQPAPGDSLAYLSGSDCPDNDVANSVLPEIIMRGSDRCDLFFLDKVPACPAGDSVQPGGLYIGGEPVSLSDVSYNGHEFESGSTAMIYIKRAAVGAGSVVARWACIDPARPNQQTYLYEWKGQVFLVDPSGTVVDAKTGAPVAGASVALQFSPARGGPFGVPSVAGYSPQLNPEPTDVSGTFSWDVGPGFWRLRVTAVGYKPYTSAVFQVPPAVSGLELKLIPDRSGQALLIDPAGQVGGLKLGPHVGKVRVPAGLKVVVRSNNVRSITVLARRFHTAFGTRIGTTLDALLGVYPPPRAGKRLVVPRTAYRVGRAMFYLSKGHVSRIVLGG